MFMLVGLLLGVLVVMCSRLLRKLVGCLGSVSGF